METIPKPASARHVAPVAEDSATPMVSPICCNCSSDDSGAGHRNLCENSDLCICRHYHFICNEHCKCKACRTGAGQVGASSSSQCQNSQYPKCNNGTNGKASGCMGENVTDNNNCACSKAGRICFYDRDVCIYCSCEKTCNNAACPKKCKCVATGRGRGRICTCLFCDNCNCDCSFWPIDEEFIEKFMKGKKDRNNTFGVLVLTFRNRTLPIKQRLSSKGKNEHAEENFCIQRLRSYLFAAWHGRNGGPAMDKIRDLKKVEIILSREPCYHHDCHHTRSRSVDAIATDIEECNRGGSGKKCTKVITDIFRMINELNNSNRLNNAITFKVFFYDKYMGAGPNGLKGMQRRQLDRERLNHQEATNFTFRQLDKGSMRQKLCRLQDRADFELYHVVGECSFMHLTEE